MVNVSNSEFLPGDVLESPKFGGRVIVVDVDGELQGDLGPYCSSVHRLEPLRYYLPHMVKIGNLTDNPELAWDNGLTNGYVLTEADIDSATGLFAVATIPSIIEWMNTWRTANNDPRQAQQLAIGEYALSLQVESA